MIIPSHETAVALRLAAIEWVIASALSPKDSKDRAFRRIDTELLKAARVYAIAYDRGTR